jgi:hypothetical protein
MIMAHGNDLPWNGSAPNRGSGVDWTAYVEPGRVFDDPQDVLQANELSLQEKRAILASWASDACAIDSCPGWRSWPGAAKAVPIDRILDALAFLDGTGRSAPPPPWKISAGGGLRRISTVRTAKTL